MVELRDILHSQEMTDVIHAIDALRSKFGSVQTHKERQWPVALALVGKYKAKPILDILLNDDPYYRIPPGWTALRGFGDIVILRS